MNQSFWKDKKVLVTGHTGFKGSWLSIWLKKVGADVIGFANSIPTIPSLFELVKLDSKMKSITGDVRNFKQLKKVISEQQPEIVFHMAAQSLVRKSYLDPINTFSTNVMGTVNLLEVIRKSVDVRVVINVTSDKCYENSGAKKSFKEEDPMGGFDPYSSSKGCSELVTSSFRNSFFNFTNEQKDSVFLASVRAGNVIGGGDWAKDRLIPDILRGILENKEINIRYPNAVRPWQHVLDPLNGYLLLAEKLWREGPKFAGPWNFGPKNDEIRSVSWVFERIVKEWGKNVNWKTDKNNPHEEDYLLLNCEKAMTELGWTPKLDLESMIKWTVNWYKSYETNSDMYKITENQIDNFLHL